jgi:hypothetical protein
MDLTGACQGSVKLRRCFLDHSGLFQFFVGATNDRSWWLLVLTIKPDSLRNQCPEIIIDSSQSIQAFLQTGL